MIDQFLEYITVEKRYSFHTIVSYKKDLIDFLNFTKKTEGVESIDKIDKKVVKNFMADISQSGLSKRTINRKLSSLRSYYLFLLKLGEIDVSPMQTIDSLKFYPEKRIPFSQEEMESLGSLEGTLNNQDFLKRLIIEVFYQTGIRKSELCNLLLENVDFSNKQMKILGKGNKERYIPMSDDLIFQMKYYFSEVRKPSREFDTYFFVNKNGKKLGEKFVYSAVNNYFSILTSKEKRSPHILRHTFATHVLNNGAEISKVQKIMGHASLVSTQVYTSANIEELKKVFNKAHPRATEK